MDIDEELDDSSEFIIEVKNISNGSIQCFSPTAVYLTKIDNWFDYKWSGFSNKVMGAFGVRSFGRLTIPPFHPNRVLYSKKYSSTNFDTVEAAKLHVAQESSNNEQRYIMNVADNAIFIWYSGSTTENGHGSILVYMSRNSANSGFYIGYNNDGGTWNKRKTTGMSLSEINLILDAAESCG